MTSNRNGKEEEVERIGAKRRNVGRPSKAGSFRKLVMECLMDDVCLPTRELLRRARLAGYQGQKSAFYALVQSLRPTSRRSVVRPEALPAEFTTHAFGRTDVRFADGRRSRVQFLVTRLEYSRWVEVSLVVDQRVDTLCRALVEHFKAIGGVPLVVILERPGPLVRVDGATGRLRFHPMFTQIVLHLGIGVEVVPRRRSYRKGGLSDLMSSLRRSFFGVCRFVDEADMGRQLSAWTSELNTRPSRTARGVPLNAKRQEEPRLRPIHASVFSTIQGVLVSSAAPHR